MNLNENQRWNQVLWKGKDFLLRVRHPSWCPLCRIKEWNVFLTTISWPTDVISHGGQWDTIRESQMMVTTKQYNLADIESCNPLVSRFLWYIPVESTCEQHSSRGLYSESKISISKSTPNIPLEYVRCIFVFRIVYASHF